MLGVTGVGRMGQRNTLYVIVAAKARKLLVIVQTLTLTL
jgi:hypothetical protein